ncbi:MAG: hypothetical protein ACQETI_10140, partial [Halobacteriota archaeon]
MRRRRFLCTATAFLGTTLAGCAGPAASLRLTTVTDAELADRASDDLADPEASVMREVVENGSATVTEPDPRPTTDRPLSFEGRYYTLSSTVVDSETRQAYGVELDANPEATGGESVDLRNLPASDREVLRELVEQAAEASQNDGFDVARVRVYTDAEEAESRLVPDPDFEFVVVDGNAYRVGVERRREVVIHTY